MIRVMNGVITRMESGDKSQLVKTNADKRTLPDFFILRERFRHARFT